METTLDYEPGDECDGSDRPADRDEDDGTREVSLTFGCGHGQIFTTAATLEDLCGDVATCMTCDAERRITDAEDW